MATTAEASYYKLLLCAANNGAGGYATATNTASSANPGGIFTLENYCREAPDPAGNSAFLRIAENQGGGLAGYGAYGSISWTTSPWVDILAAGGYTRQPSAFQDGWRARFWAEDWGGGAHNFLMQGAGVANGSLGGVGWATTSTFAPHLWPFPNYGSYRRFIFEMTCYKSSGCDRSNFNGTEANTLNLILNDSDPSHINLTGGGIVSGDWVRGAQNITWNTSDVGSGLRFERLRVDGGQLHAIDLAGACNLGWTATSGEFARDFVPCPTGGPYGRLYTLNTASLSDGGHVVQVCSQDYGQAAGVSGTGGESCDQRAVRVDNTPPSAPGGLAIATANPARYLDRFGASWTLPADPGSPVVKVRYDIIDAAGKVVVPEKVVSATNPTKLENIEGPKAPADYRLRVWLEDAVGLSGPVAMVPIPRDTTPPASPQDVSVAAPSAARSEQGHDVRWRNITDAGSPIDAVHYRVTNGAGKVVVGPTTVRGEGVQTIPSIDTPSDRGTYSLSLWLSDQEGNVGAPVSVPLSYGCVRSEVGGGSSLSAGVGKGRTDSLIVKQGEGSIISGALTGVGGGVVGAPLCVFSNVVTDPEREFLGIAVTGAGGGYQFAVPAGPSRALSTVYRPDQRELSAGATLLTRVRPTLWLKKPVVRNKTYARFSGQIPGPHNDGVVIAIQVKSGKGWRVFRRYRTRENGRYDVRYLFSRTSTPTVYRMRTQVRGGPGYPYETGNSETKELTVRP